MNKKDYIKSIESKNNHNKEMLKQIRTDIKFSNICIKRLNKVFMAGSITTIIFSILFLITNHKFGIMLLMIFWFLFIVIALLQQDNIYGFQRKALIEEFECRVQIERGESLIRIMKNKKNGKSK